jgi:hypothetical protein
VGSLSYYPLAYHNPCLHPCSSASTATPEPCNSGGGGEQVLYHKYVEKSPEEVAALVEGKETAAELKAKRKAEQTANVERKAADKEAARQAERTRQGVKTQGADSSDEEEEEEGGDEEEEDGRAAAGAAEEDEGDDSDTEWFRQEVRPHARCHRGCWEAFRIAGQTAVSTGSLSRSSRLQRAPLGPQGRSGEGQGRPILSCVAPVMHTHSLAQRMTVPRLHAWTLSLWPWVSFFFFAPRR